MFLPFIICVFTHAIVLGWLWLCFLCDRNLWRICTAGWSRSAPKQLRMMKSLSRKCRRPGRAFCLTQTVQWNELYFFCCCSCCSRFLVHCAFYLFWLVHVFNQVLSFTKVLKKVTSTFQQPLSWLVIQLTFVFLKPLTTVRDILNVFKPNKSSLGCNKLFFLSPLKETLFVCDGKWYIGSSTPHVLISLGKGCRLPFL